jgi:plasmid stability protein
MKTWLHTAIEKAIVEQLRTFKDAVGPQLCCEVGGLDTGPAIDLLMTAFRSWQRDIVIGFFEVGNRTRGCMMEIDEVERILRNAVHTEEVVSVVDVTLIGGCAIDFTPEDGGTIELLVTAWGSHEGMAKEVAERIGDDKGCLFRGN